MIFPASTNITFTYEIYLNLTNLPGNFDSFPLPTVEVFMGENLPHAPKFKHSLWK